MDLRSEDRWLRNWRKRRAALYSISQKYHSLLKEARHRDRAIKITLAEYAPLLESGCHYCGKELLTEPGGSLNRREYRLGYWLDNVVPGCAKCSRIRGADLTVEEMKAAITAVMKHRAENP